MSEDKRLYQKDPKTKRFNVVNLPRSGAFGHRKTIDQGIVGGPLICQCNLGIGCYRITNPTIPDACDFIVY